LVNKRLISYLSPNLLGLVGHEVAMVEEKTGVIHPVGSYVAFSTFSTVSSENAREPPKVALTGPAGYGGR